MDVRLDQASMVVVYGLSPGNKLGTKITLMLLGKSSRIKALISLSLMMLIKPTAISDHQTIYNMIIIDIKILL